MKLPFGPIATRLLQLLPADGSGMGAQTLQHALAESLGQVVNAKTFAAARDSLLATGAVVKGRGRGGSLRLSSDMSQGLAALPDMPAAETARRSAAGKGKGRKIAKEKQAAPVAPVPMIAPTLTGELRSKIDAVWNAFWTGGISNPLEVIEQITYLLFLRRLDDLQVLAENKAVG